MRKLFTLVTAVILVAMVSTELEAHRRGGDGPRRPHDRRHGGIFPCLVGEFDADGDGRLSREERRAAIAARRAAILEEFDADGDGELSEEERAAARAARKAAREERRAEREAALLEEFDADGDGELSEEERAAARAARRARRLAEFDTDGDGELSREERAAARQARCDSGEMTEEEEEEDETIEALALSADFIRGDANADFELNIADPIATLSFLFVGAEAPYCMDAADANDDGSVNIADATATLGRLFSGAGPLPPPTGLPGEDPTIDDLACDGAPVSN